MDLEGGAFSGPMCIATKLELAEGFDLQATFTSAESKTPETGSGFRPSEGPSAESLGLGLGVYSRNLSTGAVLSNSQLITCSGCRKGPGARNLFLRNESLRMSIQEELA